MLPKFISDHPVWSKVAATLIGSAILYLASFVPGLYPSIWNCLKRVGGWFVSSTPTPNWLLILLSFLSLILIIMVLCRTFIREEHTITEDNYTEDQFHGIRWRWRYGRSGIWSVVPFCPGCDMQIHPRSDYGGNYYPRQEGSKFTCDHCGSFDQFVSVETRHLEDAIIRQIQRKLRTGEWRNVVIQKA